MRTWAFGTMVLALHAAALGVRSSWLALSHPRPDHPSVLTLADNPGPWASLMAAEHPQALADLTWLQVVQEVGEGNSSAEVDYRAVESWVLASVDFDPRYFAVYYTGAVLLSAFATDSAASNRVLQRGVEEVPDRFELWVLMGFNHYFIDGNLEAAAEAWSRASELEGAPPWLTALAARTRFQAGDQDAALFGLRRMVEVLPDGVRKRDAQERLKLLELERFLQRADQACAAARSETGVLPETLAQLQEQGRWDGPVTDPLGGTVYFDLLPGADRCVARSSERELREFEAVKQRAGSMREPMKAPNPTEREP